MINMSQVVAQNTVRRHFNSIRDDLWAGRVQKCNKGSRRVLGHMSYARRTFLGPRDPQPVESYTGHARRKRAPSDWKHLDPGADERGFVILWTFIGPHGTQYHCAPHTLADMLESLTIEATLLIGGDQPIWRRRPLSVALPSLISGIPKFALRRSVSEGSSSNISR